MAFRFSVKESSRTSYRRLEEELTRALNSLQQEQEERRKLYSDFISFKSNGLLTSSLVEEKEKPVEVKLINTSCDLFHYFIVCVL